jgi:hypothetical protein
VAPRADAIEIGTPRLLFDSNLASIPGRYDLSRDGKRFVLLTIPTEQQPPVTLVVNWPEEVKR